MILSDQVVIALITGLCGVAGGFFGKAGVDHARRKRHQTSDGYEGPDRRVENVIARRAEVEFQTRTSMLLDKFTDALDKANESMAEIAVAVAQSAEAVREVHKEIINHQAQSKPGVEAAVQTLRIVREWANKPPGRRSD